VLLTKTQSTAEQAEPLVLPFLSSFAQVQQWQLCAARAAPHHRVHYAGMCS